MGMDRNTIIGFVLIAALLFGMLFMNSKSSQALQEQKKKEADSIAALEKKKIDTTAVKKDAVLTDSFQQVKTQQAASGLKLAPAEELTSIENDFAKITFTSKGAQPKTVELKKFKTLDGKPVVLLAGDFNKLEYEFNNTSGAGTLKTSDLNFIKTGQKENADKSQTVTYTIQDSSGKKLNYT